jgi:hypothetical protein
MSEIIEAHEGVSAAPAIPLQKQGLGSGHIRAEAGTKQNPGRPAGELPVGDCCTIVTC